MSSNLKAAHPSADAPCASALRVQGTFVDTAFLMMAHDIKTKMTSVPGGSRDTGFKGGDGEKKGCC